MPKSEFVSYLRIPDSDDRAEFLRNARIVWEKTRASSLSRKKGRPSDEDRIKTAIQEIERQDCSYGRHWTLEEWVEKVRNKIDYSHAGATKGKATIKKYVKQWLSRGIVIVNHVPISTINGKSIEAQMDFHFWSAHCQAATDSLRSSGKIHVLFGDVNEMHRDFCSKHIPQRVRLPEPKRASWFLRKWNKVITLNKLNPVKVESRKP